MEVVNENVAVLSNYEVLSLMKEVKGNSEVFAKVEGDTTTKNDRATICYEVMKYLEQTPCKYQDKETIERFMKAMAPFKLTKAEKLQILNLRPTGEIDIQLIVEESEERLTEEDVEKLLDAVQKTLPIETSENMETS